MEESYNSAVCAKFKCSVLVLFLDHESLIVSLGSFFNLEQNISEGTESEYKKMIVNLKCKNLKSNI